MHSIVQKGPGDSHSVGTVFAAIGFSRRRFSIGVSLPRGVCLLKRCLARSTQGQGHLRPCLLKRSRKVVIKTKPYHLCRPEKGSVLRGMEVE